MGQIWKILDYIPNLNAEYLFTLSPNSISGTWIDCEIPTALQIVTEENYFPHDFWGAKQKTDLAA